MGGVDAVSDYLDGVIEERPMHGFSDGLHPSEGEGQVGQTATDPGTRQRLLDTNRKERDGDLEVTIQI